MLRIHILDISIIHLNWNLMMSIIMCLVDTKQLNEPIDGHHSRHLENQFLTSLPKTLVALSRNLLSSNRMTSWSKGAKIVLIGNPTYMPYLTLWDKISQNFAHLEGNSHKKFKPRRIFRSFYNRCYEEININYTLLWFLSFLHEKKKKKRL